MKKSKILSLLLALVFTVSMLAGCGGDSNTTSVTENEDVLKLDGYLASADPLTLSIHLHFGTNIMDDSWYWNVEGAKATNITLHGTASKTSSDSNQEFNTMLVGDVLPDIIHGTSAQLLDAGKDGALIPLQDLVKKYAPNIQAAFDKSPGAYEGSVDTDGNLYYIPVIYSEKGPTMGWFVRQDWLDKLGLEHPTTKDEYYNMLKAFKEQDPNGNGKNDEIPYLDRHNSVINLVQLWDVSKSNFDVDSEGNVYSPKMTEGYKTAIGELSKWYAEGLIDQEIFSRQNPRETLLNNDIGGALVDWFSSTYAFNVSAPKLIEGFHISVMEPPANTNGTQKNYNTRPLLAGYGWGISKDNKYVAETMRYFDYWYSEEGSLLKTMGVEGEHWNYTENGEMEFSEEILNAPGGAPTKMRELGCCEIGSWMSDAMTLSSLDAEGKAGLQMYLDSDWQVDPFPSLAMTDDEQRVIAEKLAAVDTYIDEYLQHWTMGSKDINATWNEYITGLEQLGISDLIEVYQTAYDRVYK